MNRLRMWTAFLFAAIIPGLSVLPLLPRGLTRWPPQELNGLDTLLRRYFLGNALLEAERVTTAGGSKTGNSQQSDL